MKAMRANVKSLFSFTTPKASSSRTWEKYAHQSTCAVPQGAGTVHHETEQLKRDFSQNYLTPTDAEVKATLPQIEAFLKSGAVAVSIPMKEDKPSVVSFLDGTKKLLPAEHVVIIDNGSTPEVVEQVGRHPLSLLVEQDEILSILDQDRLLKVLGTDRMPRGKGVAVCAGYLMQYLLHRFAPEQAASWIIHTDADIGTQTAFQPLQYLSYGILQNPAAAHVKLAQSGRNNESTMSVRSALGALGAFTKDHPDARIRALGTRAADLFKKLAKYKWILSGTFALSYEAAMRRPFATGYIEETLIAAFAEDAGYSTVQVANENRCTDGQNDFMKESIILQQASNFTMCLASIETPVHEWSLAEIKRINECILSGSTPLAFIPQAGSDPVIGYAVENERIIPSVETLVAEDFVDFEKGKALVEKYLA